MPVNEILPFGLAVGANIMTQAEYDALTERLVGFQPGIARSERLNKVWRQAAFMAAMLGDFIVDQAAVDVRDDGDVATLMDHFITAVQTAATSGGGFALHDWLTKTANYNAFSKDRIIANTAGGAFQITLPGTPVIGQTEIWVKGNFAVNNLTVDGNGNGWAGFANPLVLNKDYIDVNIVYSAAGWRI